MYDVALPMKFILAKFKQKKKSTHIHILLYNFCDAIIRFATTVDAVNVFFFLAPVILFYFLLFTLTRCYRDLICVALSFSYKTIRRIHIRGWFFLLVFSLPSIRFDCRLFDDFAHLTVLSYQIQHIPLKCEHITQS